MEKIVIGDKLDPDFKYEVAAMPGGENIKKCFACGTCTAGCPVFHVENQYNPRKIIRMILLGMREDVLRSKAIWYCEQCYTCTANCPQDVDFSDIIFALQDLAVKEGFAPAGRREKIKNITAAANEFRRDCITLILNEGGVSIEQISKNTEEYLNKLRNTDGKDGG
jgi:heterodisulfide reductase subunit C